MTASRYANDPLEGSGEKDRDIVGVDGRDHAAEDKGVGSMFANAAVATEKEHNMTLWEGIKLYPKAIGWSMLISSCCALEGYDVALIGNFYAFPQFNRQFGELQPDGSYEVPARWQTGLSNGAQCGQIVGLIICGFLVERIGYRYVFILCLLWLSATTALFFAARDLPTLLAGEILCGVPWGVFQSIAISYAAEVCPVALRGYLTCWVNSCWGWGQLISIGVIRSQFDVQSDWSWRLPYALMWMWYPPMLLGVFLAPESPWWLVRKGRIEDAKKSFLRLTSSKDSSFNVDETIDMVRHTIALESEIHSGARYIDCFKGTNLRRTLLVCGIWATQNLSGNTFSNYSTYFFAQAGIAGTAAYDFAMGQYAINTVGVFGAWFLMSRGIGRRTLFTVGLCALCTALVAMGALGFAKGKIPDRTIGLATGSMMLVWAACYQLTVGTIAYSLVAEFPTRRLAVKTVALGRASYNIAAIIVNVLTPPMINPTAWNWHNFAGFFWAGTCFLCIVFAYFCVPEPTGRTFAELDLLFERKVPARKFASTKVDVFETDLVRGVSGNSAEVKGSEHVEVRSGVVA